MYKERAIFMCKKNFFCTTACKRKIINFAVICHNFALFCCDIGAERLVVCPFVSLSGFSKWILKPLLVQ